MSAYSFILSVDHVTRTRACVSLSASSVFLSAMLGCMEMPTPYGACLCVASLSLSLSVCARPYVCDWRLQGERQRLKRRTELGTERGTHRKTRPTFDHKEETDRHSE
jgi:hypothetical protein